MTGKCVVQSCQRTESDLFQSPSDLEQLNKWKKLLDVSKNEFFVCSLHFEDRFIETRKILKSDAYPISALAVKDNEALCECCTQTMNPRESKIMISEAVKEMMENFLDIRVS